MNAETHIRTAMILAAGYGTRLGNLTQSRPKALLELGQHTLLDIQLYKLRNTGISRVVINLHYHAELIRKYIENRSFGDLEIIFSEENEILGTGGGIAQAASFFGDEPILLVNSDIISDISLNDFLDFYRTRRSIAAITVWPSRNFRDYALVHYDTEGWLTGFLNNNHSPPDHLNTGIYMGYYILTPEARSYLQPHFSSVIENFFRRALHENKIIDVFLHHGIWIDIGTQANFETARKLIEQNESIYNQLLG